MSQDRNTLGRHGSNNYGTTVVAKLIIVYKPYSVLAEYSLTSGCNLVSSLGEEQRRAPDEAALRRTRALARCLQLTHGRGVELQEGGDHLLHTSVV